MKLKKLLTIGATTLALTAGIGLSQASAASLNGISVTPTVQSGVSSDQVKFSIKNSDSWYVTSNVEVQEKQADGTWRNIGLGAQIDSSPGQQQYIGVGNDFFPTDGTYRYEVHSTKDDTGYDVGTFTSEEFIVDVPEPPLSSNQPVTVGTVTSLNGISANNEETSLSESSTVSDTLTVKNSNTIPVTVYVTRQTAGPYSGWQNDGSTTLNLDPGQKVSLPEGNGMSWGEGTSIRFVIHSVGHGYTDGLDLGTFATVSTYVGW